MVSEEILNLFQIKGRQLVDFFPKDRFVYVIMFKKRSLHVSGNQGLVKVPNTRHYVLPVNLMVLAIWIHLSFLCD